MPYPINTLPYPFKKRLRQLLTPVELYQLQKATGHLDANHHLLPLMKRRKCFLLHSYTNSDNELVVQWFINGPDKNYITDTSPYLYQPQHMAVLEKLHESHLSDPKFHHILFGGLKHLEFRDTVMTESLLLTLKEKKIGATNFETHGPLQEQYPAGFHRLRAFFAAFPAVTCCLFPCTAYKGWLQDLLKLKKDDFQNIVISSDNYKELFSFRSKEMLKFIKRQCKHNVAFTLNIQYKVNDITQTELERIYLLFHPYFDDDDEMDDCHLTLSIMTTSNQYYMYNLKMRSVYDYSFVNLVCFFNFGQQRVGCNVHL